MCLGSMDLHPRATCVVARLATAANAHARGPGRSRLSQCVASMHQALPPSADVVSHNPLTIGPGHCAASQPPCHRGDTVSTDCSGFTRYCLGLNRRGAEAQRARREEQGVGLEQRKFGWLQSALAILCASPRLCASATSTEARKAGPRRCGASACWNVPDGISGDALRRASCAAARRSSPISRRRLRRAASNRSQLRARSRWCSPSCGVCASVRLLSAAGCRLVPS